MVEKEKEVVKREILKELENDYLKFLDSSLKNFSFLDWIENKRGKN